MRKAFSETLTKLAAQNDRVIFLTGDLGFQVFDDFQARFGPRYVNVGVAEAALVDAAAGLALEGWRPIVYSIASFMTGRAFEQIRIAINYQQLPVVVVGAGGGYTYASSGVTHHAGDDIALMSVLPGMTVVAPGDPNEVRQLLPQLLELPGPSYFRIGRFVESSYQAPGPPVLGQARLLRDGGRVAILSTGDIAPAVVEAVDVLRAEGISPLAYQVHTVKPLDTSTLEGLAGRVTTMVIVEEHLPSGGLFAAISGWLAGRGRDAPKLIRLGVPDKLVLGSPEREELQHRCNLDAKSIAQVCRSVW